MQHREGTTYIAALFASSVLQDEETGMGLLAYSSEDNRVMHIAALTPDYTHVTSTYTKIFSGLGREAPAMFKHGDVFLMATSGCAGWEPNKLEVFWSRSAFCSCIVCLQGSNSAF